MSNVELYLTIGIPAFAVLIGILMNAVPYNSVNARFSSMDARFSSSEIRVSNLDNRVTRIEAKLDIR
jgi:hypothetical protein